jgi:hypothetical protein
MTQKKLLCVVEVGAHVVREVGQSAMVWFGSTVGHAQMPHGACV